MISRYINLFICFTLSTSLVSCQIVKEGYVGVNFNAGYGGNIAKSKTYSVEGLHSVEADSHIGGSVAKTVEVPAPAVHSSLYFEKQVQPVTVEKHIEYQSIPAPAPVPVKQVVVTKEVVTAPQDVYIRKVHRRPHHVRKHYTYVDTSAEVAPPRGGFLTKLFAVGAAPAPAPVAVHETAVHKEVIVPQSSSTYTATANVNKNGNLFNDIFNIPISTLRAVNQLVNNIAGGVSVTKQVNTHTVPVEVHHPNTNANAYLHAEGHVHA